MFKSVKSTSFKMRLLAIVFNYSPIYHRTGGRAIFIVEDSSDVHIRLKLGWGTKTYTRVMFGGSMASATDPIYMIQLMRLLGKDYLCTEQL